MAFTVEDGTGVADANAYIAVAWADTYFADRAITAWTGADTVKEVAIIKATDYIETRWSARFIGWKTYDTNILSWPRWNVYNNLGAPITDVPEEVKRATAEYALRALTGTFYLEPTPDESGKVVSHVREKLGPIETETTYSETLGVTNTVRVIPEADRWLRRYLKSNGGTYR